MQSVLAQRYGGPVPRYTSYPTAPHFNAAVTPETYGGWLAEIVGGTPASLYFHVPFCAAMCWYCGCTTKVVNRHDPVTAYARALAQEIGLVADALGGRPRVEHIHWGGGTPTLLHDGEFAALMTRILTHFEISGGAEVAIEADPRTLGDSTAHALAMSGVNRVSLGIQDFTPAVQAAINRIQSFEMTQTVVERLRKAGIQSINFDLMYGLPHQTVEDVVRSVDLSVELRPSRLAVFGYAHVPWMKSHQKMIDETALPNGDQRMEQAAAASERLAEHGYRQIGLDHFALSDDPLSRALDDGTLHRNFQGYTTDRAEALLGFGASAIGYVSGGYVQNTTSIRQYKEAVTAGKLATNNGIELSNEDRMRRDAIETLMCRLRVNLNHTAVAHGFTRSHFGPERARLANLAADGLVTLDGDEVRVTEAGRPFVRAICAIFDQYMEAGPGRHSLAV